jgi:hypothetical protein
LGGGDEVSVTTIPNEVRYRTWVLAGGRCQYRGCNEPLWRDDLTLRQMNGAYLAHIIADSPAGPRGHPSLSAKLKADPINIMLLCDKHHRLIDLVDVAGHPVDLLRRYKREHEERIERQTAIQPSSRTEMVLFGTRIGDRQGRVSVEQAREAVLAEERYPASEHGIQIDMAGLAVSEADPEFWSLVPRLIDRTLQPYLSSLNGPTGYPLNHLSIFALAPIPALVYLGVCIGDTISGQVFQRQRSTMGWAWRHLEDESFEYAVTGPSPDASAADRVAVTLCLSGRVVPAEVERAVGERLPTYTVSIDAPRVDFLRGKEQLELFGTTWRRLVAEIRGRFGEECEVHLFPAVPNSVAVEIGRSRLPKVDPPLVIYDNDRGRGGFQRVLEI